MKNGSLNSYIKRNLQSVNVLTVIHEVAIGMGYLHKQEVLHGDLKVRYLSFLVLPTLSLVLRAYLTNL